eukprot:3865325-Prymnesium_polylepis.1
MSPGSSGLPCCTCGSPGEASATDEALASDDALPGDLRPPSLSAAPDSTSATGAVIGTSNGAVPSDESVGVRSTEARLAVPAVWCSE